MLAIDAINGGLGATTSRDLCERLSAVSARQGTGSYLSRSRLVHDIAAFAKAFLSRAQ